MRKLAVLTAAVTLALPSASAATPLVYGPPYAHARVIVLHGLDGTPQTMLEAPYIHLIRGLDRRFQVIVPEEPFDTTVQAIGDEAWFAHDPTGASYAQMWLREFRQIARWANRRLGRKRLLVAGISWGGMHAMLAACHDPEVSAFTVSSPVISVPSLTEFNGDTLPVLDPNTNGCARRLNRMRGFVGWGDADLRVGDAGVEHLLRLAPRLRSCRYRGLGHESNTLTLTNMIRALTGRRAAGCAS